MIVGNESIELHRESTEKGCYRISLGNTLTIPARSCKIVEMGVDLGIPAGSKEAPRVCLVESLPTLAETTGIVMGSQLVKLEQGKVLVSLINVHDEPININKGKTLRSIQPVKSVSPIQSSTTSEHASNETPSKTLTLQDIPEHARAVLDGAELTDEQLSDVCHFVLEDTERFVGPDGRTGNTGDAEHGIDVQGASPLKTTYHGIPLAKQQVADEQVDKMLEHGIIKPSNSPWSFPTVLVTKKDGSIGFCVDFRRLNSLSKKDAYGLPRIDETFNTLGGAEWFCTMDLACGFWQIKMKETDKPKTAFMTPKGLY